MRRLLRGLPAIAAIMVVTFLMVHLAPGDAVDALAGGGGDEATYEYLRSYLSLDQPLWRQFGSYAGHLVQGDLGLSFVQGRVPVTTLIADRLPATLLLMGTAVVLSSVGGVLLGTAAARRPFGLFDLGVSAASLLGYALPAFWLAQLALMAFAFGDGWFPIQGMTDARAGYTGFSHVVDVSHHLVLPALVLAISELALVTRMTRTGLLQESRKDYLRTARAKGVLERHLLFRHGLPNALLPLATIIGARIGFLFTGAVVTETVFGWPGLGSLLVTASQSRDRPLLLGMVLLVSVAVVLANLVTDLVYAWLDPRIRYG